MCCNSANTVRAWWLWGGTTSCDLRLRPKLFQLVWSATEGLGRVVHDGLQFGQPPPLLLQRGPTYPACFTLSSSHHRTKEPPQQTDRTSGASSCICLLLKCGVQTYTCSFCRWFQASLLHEYQRTRLFCSRRHILGLLVSYACTFEK